MVLRGGPSYFIVSIWTDQSQNFGVYFEDFPKDWTLRGLNQRPGFADKSGMGAPALQNNFKPDFKVDRSDLGRADTLRFNILTFVVEEDYDRAIEALQVFLNTESEYPRFKERVERFVYHAIDLVNAIRAKRKFPGVQMLTMAKQQELNEKFAAHFQELQYVLKKIEHIQNDVRIDDIRSTVWVVRAAINAAFAIAFVAFAIEVNRGLYDTTLIVIDDLISNLAKSIFP